MAFPRLATLDRARKSEANLHPGVKRDLIQAEPTRPVGPQEFRSQSATVAPGTVSYTQTHLLGIAQEIRDKILLHVDQDTFNRRREGLGAHPTTGYEALPLVCRQLYHETAASGAWARSVRIVHHNELMQFGSWIINNNHHLTKLRSLTFEIPHNSPPDHFSFYARLLSAESLSGLEELKIFGVGPDQYNTMTSSMAHPCGKHDISLTMTSTKKLPSTGQGWQHRFALLNSLQCLTKLKALTLENLNMPISQAHALKNKPRLERLRIGADPRSALHCDYLNYFPIAIFTWPKWLGAPPIKELEIDSNGIMTAANTMSRIAPTLEKVSLVIPNNFFQTSLERFDFLVQGANILESLLRDTKKLQVLKLCVHGAIYETSNTFANFMGVFKECLPRLRKLKTLELHIHSESPWLAQEFLHAIPKTVERLYLTDTLVKRDTRKLFTILNEENGHLINEPPEDDKEFNFDVAKELNRKDCIPFNTKLGFVGYEFDEPICTSEETYIDDFLRLDGRLLDRKRNKHLAKYSVAHIPFPSFGKAKYVRTLFKHATQEAINANRMVLGSCDLEDNEYYGLEDEAEKVFWNEPVAQASKRTHYSSVDVVDVDTVYKASNHWQSR
ncbi:hypothetical protein LTR10_014092 [Elasticomyces elasticus]|uniref:F-box domain-containing protein n=1 Tax=Exophiala sideris TaxID=1016849 RepID=A0ABR0J410_9EURO|nr:hypothetical protein LTR10_014092 [Elasticomyces elasticus]KAK5026498.1 hypothetical protein LTS07_007432 [Exophiala sideris]KAK5033761.1 hypothetical protein LTR13_006813 [Exophiala sideris]KAK5055583.1 hypothetical protein LTR69_008416 [Exophiala sideris]KAK5180033.1 hypothetical protein LTR44_007509 [Eurotiomycetes sp. CCFEE 6388]